PSLRPPLRKTGEPMKHNTTAAFGRVFTLLLDCADAIEYLDWKLRDRLYAEAGASLKCIPERELDPIRGELREVFRIAGSPPRDHNIYGGSIDGKVYTAPGSLINGRLGGG